MVGIKTKIIHRNTDVANQRYATVKHAYWCDKMMRRKREFYRYLKLIVNLALLCTYYFVIEIEISPSFS